MSQFIDQHRDRFGIEPICKVLQVTPSGYQRETLLVHSLHWGEEPKPARHDLSRLTPEETAVYDDLRVDRHQPTLRLEQVRVGFGWVNERLRGLSEP